MVVDLTASTVFTRWQQHVQHDQRLSILLSACRKDHISCFTSVTCFLDVRYTVNDCHIKSDSDSN